MTWKERVKTFENLLVNEYKGRTARFKRNGHVYYAEIDRTNPVKSLYGEFHFSDAGRKAYVNEGADGSFFDLVENSRYKNSETDIKNHKAKDGFTDYFDYFIKTVQINNRVFDIIATVKKKIGTPNGYTYSLFLKNNYEKKASPAETALNGFMEAENTSTNSISQSAEKSTGFEKNTQFDKTSADDIRFDRTSVDEPFANQVDNVLNGKDTTSTHLMVSKTTPDIFIRLGLSNKPIIITSVHTKTAVGYNVKNKNIHHISVDVLKSLPKLLENPAIVIESNKEGSVVAFVNAVDKNNNPVLCAIKINGYGFYNNVEIDSNVITSIYGKDSNPIGFIEKAVDDNRLLFWDKKISQELFETPGLQLPDNLKNLDSNVIIHKISQNVNTSNEQFDIRGNGYDGYSMSNNARDAYDVGEKPWSKWTKTDLINAVSSINQSKIEIAKAMSVESLKKSILHQSSWHHTSKYYNKTNFYSVSEYGVNRLGYHTDFDLRMIDSNGSYAVYYSNENAHYDEKSNKWMYDGEPIPYEEPNDIRFDRTSVDNYTEKQYNDYGWVRANEVLSTEQYKVFTENFAKALKLKEYFNKSKSGEYMIPTYERYGEEEGIGNTIVFAKGTMANPIITKIIEIDLDNETEIDKIRRNIYANARRGIQQEVGNIFRRYTSADYEFAKQGNIPSSEQYSGRNGLQRGRSGGETAKVKSIHFNEDGSREITYQDGTKEVQFDRTSADEDFNELHKDFLDEMYSNMGGVKDFDTQSIIKRGIPKINGKENLTVGEMKKQIADSTHSKVFSYASSLDLAKKLGASHFLVQNAYKRTPNLSEKKDRQC